MKKLLIVLAVLIAAAVAALVLLKPVARVAVVNQGRAVQAVPGSVTVEAEYEMELRSEPGGRVIKSELELGKPVKKGEPLVQIDPTDLELDIEHTENEYQAAKARIEIGSATKVNLKTATENLETWKRLAESGHYPPVELERRTREVEQIKQQLALEELATKQTLENFETTLKAKRRQLEKMTVRAPFDGVVSYIAVHPGDLIGGGATVARLITNTRTVEAKISEENFAGVKVGQKASVRFLPYGAWLYDATVTKILPTADPQTQRHIVHLDVQIEPEKLVPGITGEVSITVGERPAEAIVPRRALFGDSLFVVDHGRVRLRKVETGYTSLTAVEILKGVTAGEQVIVDELDRFRDGDRVRVEVVPAK